MMLNIIVIIVIFASLISAVIYMSSSSLQQAVSSNQSANAWTLAEAGYRFLSTNYLKTTDINGNLNADDDKAAFLRSANGRTYVIPNNGSFTLSIRPYWFYNATATGTITNVTAQLPGTAPTNFTMPTAGKIKLLGVKQNDLVSVISNYTGGAFDRNTGVFTCNLSSPLPLPSGYIGYSVYLVLNPSVSLNLTPGSNLTLNISNYPAGAFPGKDGLIEIETETRLYRYNKATLNGNILTLSNLQYAVQRTDASENTFTTPVTSATPISFKKYLTLQSTGKVGPEQRTLSFNQAIIDSVAPVVLKLDTVAQLSANFSQSSTITDYAVQNLNTSGGGSAAFAIINSLSTTGSGASAYKCGAFWYSGTNFINTQWESSNNLLSYDVQVKAATGNSLTDGTIGLAIRAKQESSTEPNAYFGLTFMRYNLPNLYFNRQTGGTAAIIPGYKVVGATSGATGTVQGTPEITSGSWADGNAVGKIRFASVTGTFSADEVLRVFDVNNVQVSVQFQVNGSNYFPAATDYIPNGIKPKPSDFTSARYDIGPLLLVLWERKSNGTFRWLAFKDISNDDYAKGSQDWIEPTGSCTTSTSSSSCTSNDGQIINDNASIYVRIQEKRLDLGTGGLVKLNDINLLYGDDSSRYTTPVWPARQGNAIPYDIKELRRRYTIGSPFNPIWAPQFLNQWEQGVDYFSHLESGTPVGQFQWDAVNPNITDISVLKICDDGSAACTSAENGTLRLTELVTPDSGTYNNPEIGLLACGDIRTSPYQTAGFAEFALKRPGNTAGGFIGTSFSF